MDEEITMEESLEQYGKEKRIGDMYLAATFLAYGAELSKIDRTNPHRQIFCFTGQIPEIYIMDHITPVRIEEPTFDTVETKFIAKKIMFPPEFPNALRRIKAAIYSGANYGE